jgi:SOS-response transcriptional repressor LexA
MSWQSTAKAKMRTLKITQTDLISVMGVTTRGAVGHYLSGRRTPSIDQFKALADHLGMKLDELMSDGNSMQEPSSRYSVQVLSQYPVSTMALPSAVPLIGSVPDVNFANLGIQQNTPMVPTTAPVGQRTFALRIYGDSMEPEFLEGDIIIVEPELAPESGDFVIAQHDQDITFKQLWKESGDWYLKPLNGRYPIKPLADSRIIGVVREKTKRYR